MKKLPRSNKGKWDHYHELFKKRLEQFLDEQFPNHPTEYWELKGNQRAGFQAQKGVVDRLGYHLPSTYHSDRRVTNQDVARMKDAAENHVFSRDNVRVCYRVSNGDGWVTSGSYELEKFDIVGPECRVAWSKDCLNEAIAAANAKYLMRDGCFRCAYCGTVTENEKKVTSRIISIATYGPGGRLNDYCSGKCATHDQWAHEG